MIPTCMHPGKPDATTGRCHAQQSDTGAHRAICLRSLPSLPPGSEWERHLPAEAVHVLCLPADPGRCPNKAARLRSGIRRAGDLTATDPCATHLLSSCSSSGVALPAEALRSG